MPAPYFLHYGDLSIEGNFVLFFPKLLEQSRFVKCPHIGFHYVAYSDQEYSVAHFQGPIFLLSFSCNCFYIRIRHSNYKKNVIGKFQSRNLQKNEEAHSKATELYRRPKGIRKHSLFYQPQQSQGRLGTQRREYLESSVYCII